jgi:pyridoxal phosphate enzyme (YggS family)
VWYRLTVASVKENTRRILNELPAGVELVAAGKSRRPEEILEAVEAGVKIVGENYVQEAAKAYELIGRRVEWHFIGHLQRNKVKMAVKLFDMIQTVDSLELAREIDRRCTEIGKVMPVLIEVNSGREEQKAGVLPEAVESLIKEMASLPGIRVMGLMTMGPWVGDPESSRPYFMATRQIFNQIKKLNLPNVEMKYLSMGMTNSYKVAIAEGANMVRLGIGLFGGRAGDKD